MEGTHLPFSHTARMAPSAHTSGMAIGGSYVTHSNLYLKHTLALLAMAAQTGYTVACIHQLLRA